MEKFNAVARRCRSFLLGDKLILGTRCAEGVTRVNLAAYVFTTFMTVTTFVFVNAAQPAIIRNILSGGGAGGGGSSSGGGHGGAGGASGNTVLFAELTVIFTSVLWGMLADRVGGRVVTVCGFVIVSVALAVIPSSQSLSILVLLRCVFSLGGAALGSTISSLLSDSVLVEDKGKGAALAGIAASCGAVFAALGLLRIPAAVVSMASHPLAPIVPTSCAYYTTAALACGTAIFASAFLFKKGGFALLFSGAWMGAGEREAGREGVTGRARIFLEGFQEGAKVLREDIVMLLALAAAFLARGDASIVTVFLSLWVFQYATDVSGKSAAEAGRLAGSATGIVYTFSLLSAPGWGKLCDHIGDVKALAVASFLSFLSYCSLGLLSNPTSGLGYFICAVMGVAEIAMVVTSSSLLSRRAPPATRGLFGGMASVSSSLGILVSGAVGGAAYDSISPGGPFIVQGGLSACMCACVLALLYIRPGLCTRTSARTHAHTASEEKREDSRSIVAADALADDEGAAGGSGDDELEIVVGDGLELLTVMEHRKGHGDGQGHGEGRDGQGHGEGRVRHEKTDVEGGSQSIEHTAAAPDAHTHTTHRFFAAQRGENETDETVHGGDHPTD